MRERALELLEEPGGLNPWPARSCRVGCDREQAGRAADREGDTHRLEVSPSFRCQKNGGEIFRDEHPATVRRFLEQDFIRQGPPEAPC